MTTDLPYRVTMGVVVVIASAIAGGWLAGLVSGLLARSGLDADVRQLATEAVRPFVVLLGGLIAVDLLHVDPTAVLIVLTLAGLAGVLAIRDPLANLASGVVLRTTRPFGPGDRVTLGEHTGVVLATHTMSVLIEAEDGSLVTIPNVAALRRPVENHSLKGRRRLCIPLTGIHPDDREPILDAVGAVEGVLDDPPPVSHGIGVDGSSLLLEIHAWVPSDHHAEIRAEIVVAIAQVLATSSPEA